MKFVITWASTSAGIALGMYLRGGDWTGEWLAASWWVAGGLFSHWFCVARRER